MVELHTKDNVNHLCMPMFIKLLSWNIVLSDSQLIRVVKYKSDPIIITVSRLD